MPCISPEGQTTIGVRRRSLEGVPIKRGATCETPPCGTKNEDVVGRLNEGRFGTGAREVPDMQMQDKENNYEKGGGDREGHLGFGDVDAGHSGDMDESIRDRRNCGTVECRGGGNEGMGGRRPRTS